MQRCRHAVIGIIVIAVCSAGGAFGEVASPFLIGPVPDDVRQHQAGGDDYFLLDMFDVMPETSWCTGVIVHLGPPPVGDNPRELRPRRFQIIGAIAVDLNTGQHRMLRSTVERLGIGLVEPLSRASCAVGVARLTADEVPKWAEHYEQATVWEWRPDRHGDLAVVRRGPHMGLPRVAFALDRTPYELVWPESFDEDWDGYVALTRRTHESNGLERLAVYEHLRRARALDRWGPLMGPGFLSAPYWMEKIRYYPGHQEDSVIRLSAGETQEGEDTEERLSEIRLDETATPLWRRTQSSLEQDLGSSILYVQVVHGVTRPYEWLPLFVKSASDAGGWCCWLNPENGKIRKAPAINKDEMPIVRKCASACGRFVAMRRGRAGGLAILDGSTGKVVQCRFFADQLEFPPEPEKTRRFAIDELSPVGFTNELGLVFQNKQNIWMVEPPYTGKPRLVFSLHPDGPMHWEADELLPEGQ